MLLIASISHALAFPIITSNKKCVTFPVWIIHFMTHTQYNIIYNNNICTFTTLVWVRRGSLSAGLQEPSPISGVPEKKRKKKWNYKRNIYIHTQCTIFVWNVVSANIGARISARYPHAESYYMQVHLVNDTSGVQQDWGWGPNTLWIYIKL